METVCEPTTGEAIERLAAALDDLQHAGVTPTSADDARGLIVALETQARRMRSVQVDLVEQIDRTATCVLDGHTSAKVMVRHLAQLSSAEAHRRAQCARALRTMPAVRNAFASGRIGGCQVERIARAHANPRVRAAVEANEESFAHQAEAQEYRAFDAMVDDWVRLVDEDGTRDRDQRAHENRDAALHQGFDGSWTLSGRCGSLAGAELESIFKAFLEAETLADWDAARAERGAAATASDLPRTDAQRRFDALHAAFRSAATARADAPAGSTIETNIVIDHHTFERMLARLTGVDPLLQGAFDPFPTRSYRCSTLDGRPVEATVAVAQALVGHVRRVVVGADGVVIDMGRRRRLFTGAAALAVKLQRTTCYWPGCHTPVTACQCDHLRPWSIRADGSGGGCTCPGNGGPGCGRHNHDKERGYRVRRDPTGHIHVYRPDGTEIT
ncbi:DUF222 domain-containing protein [Iamia majanohamensis]|uniref:DUF222 domain-containing protein n=1 Tax=Iamia majanohamensis TaxID=467976 RepID=A0AAE9Y9C7_9ACTN|nr:DUF222 domain-containing protein [Iamia majanohamensis]WCO68176.1 DUF222 domain-containing protein [Iamia majanohamensis]